MLWMLRVDINKAKEIQRNTEKIKEEDEKIENIDLYKRGLVY